MSAIDFDSLWDYSKPGETERKFREVLTERSEDDPFSLELLLLQDVSLAEQESARLERLRHLGNVI